MEATKPRKVKPWLRRSSRLRAFGGNASRHHLGEVRTGLPQIDFVCLGTRLEEAHRLAPKQKSVGLPESVGNQNRDDAGLWAPLSRLSRIARL